MYNVRQDITKQRIQGQKSKVKLVQYCTCGGTICMRHDKVRHAGLEKEKLCWTRNIKTSEMLR